MKPHEETWIPEEVIVMHERHDGQKEAREVLGAAAPEMARAILALRRPDGSCWCHHSRDIYEFGHDTVCGNTSTLLRRIGVLP